MRVIKKFKIGDQTVTHVICSHNDADYISERFGRISRRVAEEFCKFMEDNKLIVGIVGTYDEGIRWHGAHFYVGNKNQKYYERADLSINGFMVCDNELRKFMNGIDDPRWHNMPNPKENNNKNKKK